MIAADLKSWRTRLRLSQSQAATALNVPQKTYQNWERRQRAIPSSIDRLTTMIADHGVPVVEAGRVTSYDRRPA